MCNQVEGKEKQKDAEAAPVVIGGMVMDINASPSLPPIPRTTNPGKVHYALGGVARNIAECMSKLGTKPFMISAVGLDMPGNLLLDHWKSAGLSLEGIRKHQDIETAVVCNIFNTDGELEAGVASVEAVEKFVTPEWIHRFKWNVSSAPVLLVDANLSPPALESSCRMAADQGIPVWFEPVSVAKSKRVASVVKYITFASPNEDELISMANALSGKDTFHPIQKHNSKTKSSPETLFQMLKPAIWVLLEKGIKILIVTVGSDGVFVCSKEGNGVLESAEKRSGHGGFGEELYKIVTSRCHSNRGLGAIKGQSSFVAVHFPAIPTSVVRLTGAGDCLVGGAVASICAGLGVMRSVAVGVAAAKAAVEVETNVPSKYSLVNIADDAGLVYAAAKPLFHPSML